MQAKNSERTPNKAELVAREQVLVPHKEHDSTPVMYTAAPHQRMEMLDMQVRKSLLAVVAGISMLTAGAVYAGPPVTVTFKNLGNDGANYMIVTINESSTYTNASPKPISVVQPSNSDTYIVQSNISPNANSALVRYKLGTSPLGGKECQFSTHYTKLPGSGGAMIPNWTKNANGSGSAICTATITSTNITTHAWAVEFTMQ